MAASPKFKGPDFDFSPSPCHNFLAVNMHVKRHGLSGLFSLHNSAVCFLLFMVSFFTGCSGPSLEKRDIPFDKTDGVYVFRMNQTGDDAHFFGTWAAPLLGRNSKFFRSAVLPDAGLSFELLKKEAIIIEGRLYNEVPALELSVNGKHYPVPGRSFKKLIPASGTAFGKNRLQLISEDHPQVDIQEIKIYPRRLMRWMKAYKGNAAALTPARFDFYFNPERRTKLELSFLSQKAAAFQAQITISSEKSQKSWMAEIHSGKILRIPALNRTIHHVRIDIPEIKSGLIRLHECRTAAPRIEPRMPSGFKTEGKRKNILLILLDAARADHFGCYGYKRPTTPNIDKLADRSSIFRNVYSEASYTLASTGTLLTGLPPDVHGVVSAFFNSLGSGIKTFPELLRESGYYTAAVSGNPYFGKSYHYDRGFDDFIELYRQSGAVDAGAFIEPFRLLMDKMERKPFFIYLHVREPHHPYKMPPPFFGRYQKRFKRNSAAFKQEADRVYKGLSRSADDFQFLTDIYDENLSYADYTAGKILEILQSTGRMDDTIVIVTADHGEGLGEHGLVGHNMVLHREGIHIPLIIHFPGQKKGPFILDRPAVTSDLVVTLCDLFHVDYPYEHLTRGHNLFSLPEKRMRICRSLTMPSNYAGYMVESKPYRMIFFPHSAGDTCELYNALEDPDTLRPLPDKTAVRDVLMTVLRGFLRDAAGGVEAGTKPELGKKELENLRSLGYIK